MVLSNTAAAVPLFIQIRTRPGFPLRL